VSNVTVWLLGNRWAGRRNGTAGLVFADSEQEAASRAYAWNSPHRKSKNPSEVWNGGEKVFARSGRVLRTLSVE
jgi:hypothetical protein